ncbi:hypothetical protein COHA_007189 [Chlorella ohadii]|uniref:Thioredoxin domain-containing protein n=1 Tax=Chlorella ohadii TaxID=2649997 RepID=A0AAD5H4H4_9CHLO|nr:hypothetical protein COHA_007189 [Chlorella ohadii]
MPPRPAAEAQPELKRAPGWRRFLAPYYTSTLAVLPIYGLARHWFDETGGSAYSRVGSSDELWEKERLIIACLGAMLAARAWRRLSIDHLMGTATTYIKGATGLLLWFIDYRFAIYYALLLVVMYLFFPQPLFTGPTAVRPLTPDAFKSLVEDGPADVAWLVEFYAPWAPACIHLEPVVAELSLKYSCSRLQFGRVDAPRWPQLAQAHKVPVYGAIPALPMFILFEKGKEVGRIPHMYEDGSISTITVQRQDIVAAFGLDGYLAAAQDDQRGGPSRAAAAKGGSTKKRR